MTRVLVAAFSAALLIGAVVSPANAEHGGGFHGGAGVLHGGGGFHGGAGVFHGGDGFHGGEHFHEAFRGGGFTRAFMASAFMITTAFTTMTTFVDPPSSAALRSALG